MNIYDFDGTIYDGDSTVDFYKYCTKYYPKTWLSVWNALGGLFLYMFGTISKTAFKQKVFSFLQYVPNVEDEVAAFWSTHERKLKAWYLSQKQDDDVIISASPEFLLSPVCDKLGVSLLGSRVDSKTGVFDGLNCHGEEKVRRLTEVIDISSVAAFYSDSIADKPLADLIPQSFMVRDERIVPWNEYKPSAILRTKNTFMTPQFFVFVFCGGCGTVVNFCFSLLFAQRLDPTLAYVGGYAVSLFVTYALNSVLIFKQKLNTSRFVKFVISYIPNFAILFTFVVVLLNIFHVWEVIVYASAALFGLPITFLLVKLFAFKDKRVEEEVNG
jgi:phosphoserine phosphatase/putative flippase GtrA